MTKELLALGIVVMVHVVGLVALIWLLVLNEQERPDWRGWWPHDGDDGPRDPSPVPGGHDLPLADALPSALRLREPARIGAGRRPPRRPEHVPERTPRRPTAPR